MAGCGDTDLRHRQSLAGGRLVVVRRTFIEVVDEAEAHGMPNSWRDLRRSHSDSMLGANGGVVVAQAAVLATGPERDLIADSGLDGLSAMGAKSPEFSVDEFHAEPELGVTSCSDVLLSSGTPSNGGDPASYESLDSSFGVSAGSPPVTWPASPSGCASHPGDCVADPMDDCRQLLSENARLLLENRLLRERARTLGHLREPGASATALGRGTHVGEPRFTDAGAVKAQAPDPKAPIEERTTLMLRNVPNNYTRSMLLSMLDGEGFVGGYDFLYLPMDFTSGACLGYAFVNLVVPAQVGRFWRAFDGYARWTVPSRKVCRVSWSGPHQGLEAHIERFRNSPVMHGSVCDDFKPVLFAGGLRVAFPGPNKAPRPPRMRRRGEGPRSQPTRRTAAGGC